MLNCFKLSGLSGRMQTNKDFLCDLVSNLKPMKTSLNLSTLSLIELNHLEMVPNMSNMILEGRTKGVSFQLNKHFGEIVIQNLDLFNVRNILFSMFKCSVHCQLFDASFGSKI